MNVTPVSNSIDRFTLKSNSLGKRCIISDNKPVPETSKDEVAFRGYNEFIREAATLRYADKLQCESLFFDLFEKLINLRYAKTEDFRKFLDVYEHKTLHSTLKAIAGRKFSAETEPLAEELLKKSQKGDLVLASHDGIPVFTLRTDEMPSFWERKFSLKPRNIVELQLNSELHGSSCFFGLNPRGEFTFEQLSNIDLPKYTSFHNSSGKVKVFTSGRYDQGNFAGKYFDRNGLYNPFLSILLR